MNLRRAVIVSHAGRAAAVLLAAVTIVGAGLAQPPGEMQALLDCRQVADGSARLACFDRHVAALGQAIDRRDVVVVDQPQIRKARRSVFGLALPNLDGLLGRRAAENTKDKAAPEANEDEIEATIATASRDGYGRWTIVLDDGARWVQIDERDLARDPAHGQSIRIRRASMGSYLANIDRQIAIRVRRER